MELKMKIETRADCIVCGADIVDARFRTYCSDKCRTKRNNEKNKAYMLAWRAKHLQKIKEQRKLRNSLARLAKVKNKMK